MEWLVLLLTGGAAAYAWQGIRDLREERRGRAAELDDVRRAAEEDVAVLGEQLRRLDAELAGQCLDEEASEDLRIALDAYDRAARTTGRLRTAEEVTGLLGRLAAGRYAMVCVRARAAGLEAPEPRSPCFFNPQHGPSTTVVEWRPPTRGTRTLPACRQCAARLAGGMPLNVHAVSLGSRRVPYWEVYLPQDRDDHTPPRLTTTAPCVSWVLDTAMSGDSDLGHYVGGHPRSASSRVTP